MICSSAAWSSSIASAIWFISRPNSLPGFAWRSAWPATHLLATRPGGRRGRCGAGPAEAVTLPGGPRRPGRWTAPGRSRETRHSSIERPSRGSRLSSRGGRLFSPPAPQAPHQGSRPAFRRAPRSSLGRRFVSRLGGLAPGRPQRDPDHPADILRGALAQCSSLSTGHSVPAVADAETLGRADAALLPRRLRGKHADPCSAVPTLCWLYVVSGAGATECAPHDFEGLLRHRLRSISPRGGRAALASSRAPGWAGGHSPATSKRGKAVNQVHGANTA